MSIEKIIRGNFTATIDYDHDNSDSPRDWDNLGTMFCEHKRYNLGDKHDLNFDDCESWEDHEKVIKAEFGKDCIMFPIYMYDHSGIAISVTPFGCRWDSGRIGTIAVSRADIREEYKVKKVTKELKEKVEKILKGEVETYNQYLSGEVYRFDIVENMVTEEGEEYEEYRDSCCGFYDLEDMKSEVNSILNYYEENQKKVMEE